jgi:hypothetical protein
LADGGRPHSAILASPKISISERFAVDELRSFVEQISGADLPICEPGQVPPGDTPTVWIVVGCATAQERHRDLELESLGTEGFLIKTIGGDLVIAGGEKRGTLYVGRWPHRGSPPHPCPFPEQAAFAAVPACHKVGRRVSSSLPGAAMESIDPPIPITL